MNTKDTNKEIIEKEWNTFWNLNRDRLYDDEDGLKDLDSSVNSKISFSVGFEKEVKEYYKKNDKWWWDQCFLRDVVWPIAKKDCLDFDSNKLKDWGTKMLDFPPHKASKIYPRVGMSIIRNDHL